MIWSDVTTFSDLIITSVRRVSSGQMESEAEDNVKADVTMAVSSSSWQPSRLLDLDDEPESFFSRNLASYSSNWPIKLKFGEIDGLRSFTYL